MVSRSSTLLFALLVSLPAALVAQRAEPARVAASSGDSRACAYGIVPVALRLGIERGFDEVSVASLGFPWARDLSALFDESARAVWLNNARFARSAR